MLKFHLTKSFHLKLISAYNPRGEGIQLHPIVKYIQDLLWALIKSGLIKFYIKLLIKFYIKLYSSYQSSYTLCYFGLAQT